MVIEQHSKISNGLSVLIFCIAIISSGFLISGDQLGKVNLLFLLLLFVLWPVFSFFLVIFLSVFKKQKSIVPLMLTIPIWPRSWLAAIRQLKRDNLFKLWLFKESQKLVLVFSVGCLCSFVLVLLFNDVTFVWRSTLLSANQIFELLKGISYPWLFLESAQPVFSMVSVAQDSRLAINPSLSAASIWWKYVFMAQLCYSFIPRIGLFIWASLKFKQSVIVAEKAKKLSNKVETKTTENKQLEGVSSVEGRLSNYLLLTWNPLPSNIRKELEIKLGEPVQQFDLSQNFTLEIEQKLISDSREKLLIVSAWEPPMGELQDFMQSTQGIIIPIDWQDDKTKTVSQLHLDEWRRFCYPLAQWQLQQLD